MNWILLGLGVVLSGVAVYIASDPMSRARNWVSGREWERDPEGARLKQYRYTYGVALFIAGLGMVFVVLGVVL